MSNIEVTTTAPPRVDTINYSDSATDLHISPDVFISARMLMNKIDAFTEKLDQICESINPTVCLTEKLTRLQFKYEELEKRLSEFELIVDGNEQEEEVDEDATEEPTEEED
jgi:hypothetical protein